MGYLKLATLLLQHKGSLWVQDRLGNTPVHYAMRWALAGSGSEDRIKALHSISSRSGYKEALKTRNNDGRLPMDMCRFPGRTGAGEMAKRSGSAQLRRRPTVFNCIDSSSSKKSGVRRGSPGIADMCTATTEMGSSVGNNSSADEDSAGDRGLLAHKGGVEAYNIIRMLGKGSFGEVFLVEEKTTRRLFAMKVIQKAKIMSQNLVKYVLAERRVMAKTHHTFIVKLHAAFQTRSRLFMVMEYCPGGDLAQHLQRERRFPEARARVYLAEIVLAIEDLHKRGIIFR